MWVKVGDLKTASVKENLPPPAVYIMNAALLRASLVKSRLSIVSPVKTNLKEENENARSFGLN